jgi:hypothetical protein
MKKNFIRIFYHGKEREREIFPFYSSLYFCPFLNIYSALYGRIIISEQHQQVKTLKPVPLGGVAGGTKYVVNGTSIPPPLSSFVSFSLPLPFLINLHQRYSV